MAASPLGRSWAESCTGSFTQRDPIGLGGGLNQYGYAGGDPINNSDPFGLCPYEGEQRTANVKDCSDGEKKKIFEQIAADTGAESRETIDAFVDNKYNFDLSNGKFTCAGIQVDACIRNNQTVIVNVSGRSMGAIASDVVHEAGGHGTEPTGTLAGPGEIRAWDKALNFYDRLPSAMKVDQEYNGASFVRSTNRKQFESVFCGAYPGTCP